MRITQTCLAMQNCRCYAPRRRLLARPVGLLGGRPHFTARRGAARRCWSCSSPRRPSPAGSCSPSTELLAGRAKRLTRRGAPRQPRRAARRCSPPGGPARRQVELQSQIEPINLVTAHTELVQVYSVNFPTLLQSFGHFSMNLVRNRAIVTTKTPLFANRLQRQTAEKSTLFAER